METEKWVVFSNKLTGKELIRYTVEGTFEGEMKATIGLLAFENDIDADDIKVKVIDVMIESSEEERD